MPADPTPRMTRGGRLHRPTTILPLNFSSGTNARSPETIVLTKESDRMVRTWDDELWAMLESLRNRSSSGVGGCAHQAVYRERLRNPIHNMLPAIVGRQIVDGQGSCVVFVEISVLPSFCYGCNQGATGGPVTLARLRRSPPSPRRANQRQGAC